MLARVRAASRNSHSITPATRGVERLVGRFISGCCERESATAEALVSTLLFSLQPQDAVRLVGAVAAPGRSTWVG